MPTYTYKCNDPTCGYVFDISQRISDNSLSICPNCNQVSLKKIIKNFPAIKFNAAGFYAVDNYQYVTNPDGSISKQKKE